VAVLPGRFPTLVHFPARISGELAAIVTQRAKTPAKWAIVRHARPRGNRTVQQRLCLKLTQAPGRGRAGAGLAHGADGVGHAPVFGDLALLV
jgi:hypothetical protein